MQRLMEVYHGSTLAVPAPDVKKGRANLDFGPAFYLTRLYEQAARWAEVVYGRYEEGAPTVNVYTLDMEGIVREGYRILRLEAYDKTWLDFIVASRSGQQPWAPYDLVEGGVANDRVIDTVEGYMNGDFSADVAIGRLKFVAPNHQIAILNQQIADRYLLWQRAVRLSQTEPS